MEAQQRRSGLAGVDGPTLRNAIEAAIHRLTVERGIPPTQADVMAATGITSPGHLRTHLAVLVDEGRVVRAAGSRGMRLPSPLHYLRALHIRILEAIAEIGQGAPIGISAIAIQIIDPYTMTDSSYVVARLLEDLLARGLVRQIGHGYVLADESLLVEMAAYGRGRRTGEVRP